MDSQILYVLFTAVINSSAVLGERADFAEKLRSMRDRLPKPEIGKYGQIMEWAEDYDEVEPGHRHISQLYALYPAHIISPAKTPENAKAARATLERRLSHGGGHTGWSRAWIINMWARLLDGEKVGENVQALLAHSTSINMFDMHPPFQIDGNFGGGAGIAEALLQSRYDGLSGTAEIEFLPALPPLWKSGNARGFKARGGFETAFEWSEGSLVNADVISFCGNRLAVRCAGSITVTCGDAEIKLTENNGAFEFDTGCGKNYRITAK